MSVTDWFFAGVGITGALYTFRLVAGKVAWGFDHYPDADNVLGGIVMGTFAAVLWPIVLPSILIHEHARSGIASVRHLVVERVLWRPHRRSELERMRR